MLEVVEAEALYMVSKSFDFLGKSLEVLIKLFPVFFNQV